MASNSKKKPSSGPTSNQPTVMKFNLPKNRVGLPALDSILDIFPLATQSAAVPGTAGGPSKAYRVIRTTEVDGYEDIATSQGDLAPMMALAPAPAGDKFAGTARKAAKLSIANKPIENFTDLRTLINSLTKEATMIDHIPEIKTASTSNRVDEEKRNVRVKAFLYAASREDDNDFHLIVGRSPTKTPELYMTMELSGLPSSSSQFFNKLKAARAAYKDFFAQNLPGTSYDFYDPPIPIQVEGSLFFDMSHASGQRPGPKSLKSRMPVIWEVHPITKIVFEP
jgi:hypothetical protein